jgi:hypothetical protein
MNPIRWTRWGLLVAWIVALPSLPGCGRDGDDGGEGTATSGDVSSVVPGHDVALYFIRDCDWDEARLMADRAATERLPEAEGEALVRHVDQLILLSDVCRANQTGGPIADGCLSRLFGAPYQDRTPTLPWRTSYDLSLVADTLAALEAAGHTFEPVRPPAEDPRFTYELAAILCSLDQHDHVAALLDRIPEGSRHRFWHPYITAISTVRREVNADWRNYDACAAAVDSLLPLVEMCEADREIAPMAPVVLFNLGMIERHRRRHRDAKAYVERAFAHVESRGAIRNFLSYTWTRL